MSLAITAGSQVVAGATMAEGNAHDSKTLEATLRQYQTLTDLLGVQVGYPDRFKTGSGCNKKRRCGAGFANERPLNPLLGT